MIRLVEDEAFDRVEFDIALIDVILKAKPASSKGVYLKKIAVSSTMGPGFKVDPASPLKAA